ncbi:MAG TPA: hypothetical protein DCZ43_08175, partial [candidate division Zixibacteria bacterium]|nr:hypothetical protein [candidate division Zixibacteria bacterium]
GSLLPTKLYVKTLPAGRQALGGFDIKSERGQMKGRLQKIGKEVDEKGWSSKINYLIYVIFLVDD